MVFSGVAVSGSEDGSVSVLSGCVGAVAEGSGAVVALSAGVLLGVAEVVVVVGSVVEAAAMGEVSCWVLTAVMPMVSPLFKSALPE